MNRSIVILWAALVAAILCPALNASAAPFTDSLYQVGPAKLLVDGRYEHAVHIVLGRNGIRKADGMMLIVFGDAGSSIRPTPPSLKPVLPRVTWTTIPVSDFKWPSHWDRLKTPTGGMI